MLDEVIINKDEKVIIDICEKLNKSIKIIIHKDPAFIYSGSIEKGYYSIYNSNNYGKNIDLSLNFRLYYPNKTFHNHDKKNINFKNNKFYNINNNKLLYAKIEWFSVNPTGLGIGSRVISHLIDILENIEFILLSPKNCRAKKFWTLNQFVEEDYFIKFDERIISSASNRLIYKY